VSIRSVVSTALLGGPDAAVDFIANVLRTPLNAIIGCTGTFTVTVAGQQ
jgi:hypothetical protein